MKKIETLIIEISKADREIHRRFNPREVKEAIEKLEKEGKIPISSTDLINVLYEGAMNELENPLMYD